MLHTFLSQEGGCNIGKNHETNKTKPTFIIAVVKNVII